MNTFPSFMIADQVLLWAANVLIHATVLTAIVLSIALIFRKSAVTRYWILCLGMLLVLASPLISALIQSRGDSLLTLTLPVEDVPIAVAPVPTPPLPPAINTVAKIEQPAVFDPGPMTSPMPPSEARPTTTQILATAEPALVAPVVETAPIANVHSRAEWMRFIAAGLLATWVAVTLVLLMRMAIGWSRMVRILKAAKPVEHLELQQVFERACAAVGCNAAHLPRFVVSDAVSGPIAAGIFGGTVVLPKRLVEQVDATNLADVLVHEVAHVVRRDQIVVLVQNLVTALYWPHPLVKSLNRELAKAREEVCDNFVLNGTEAPAYSRTLLSLAELVQRPEALPGSVGFFTDRWKLEHRVAGLLDAQRDRKTFLNKRSWIFLLATTVLLAAMTCVGTITFATAKQVEDIVAADGENVLSAKADNDPTVRGVVLKPDGSPAAGATIRWAAPVYADMRGVLGEDYETPMKEVVADEHGKFEISIDSNPYEGMPVKGTRWEDYWKKTVISATLPSFAGQWVKYEDIEKSDSVTVQLVEDIPIRGRVIGLEGRPASNVTIEVKNIAAPPNGSLDAWLKSVRNSEPAWVAVKHLPREIGSRLLGVQIATKTDKDGVFKIKGVGQERSVWLQAHGNGIAFEKFQVVTRPMEPLAWDHNGLPDATMSVFGDEFTITGRPSRAVTGTVTNAKTGIPLANVDVAITRSSGDVVGGMWLLATKTDSQGKFRIDGVPKGEGNDLMFRPADNQPYFQREIDVPNPDGIDPIVLDVELHRGIWIEGKVVDKQSREPIAGVRMHYLPLRTNKFTKGLPEFKGGNIDGVQNRFNTDANGKYRLVGLPGPAVIGANSINKLYRSGVGFEELNTPANKESGWLRTYRNPLTPGPKWPNSMVQITPDEETQKIQVDLELDPGLTVQANVVDENDEWLTGATVDAGVPYSFKRVAVKSGPVDIINLAPNESRAIIIHHKQRGLGVVHHLTAADFANGKVNLSARRVTKISGRLVDDDGPLSGVSVIPAILPTGDFSSTLPTVSTDENGIFQTVLIPGCKYRLRMKGTSFRYAFSEEKLEVTAGKDIELGTMKLADHKFKRTRESKGEAGNTSSVAPTAAETLLKFAGRVVDKDAGPIEGAELRLCGAVGQPGWISEVIAVSGKNGEFSFERTMPAINDVEHQKSIRVARLVASREGYGVSICYAVQAAKPAQLKSIVNDEQRRHLIDKLGGDKPLVMTMPPDKNRVRGRILNTDGQPVVGATVAAVTVSEGKTGTLDAWNEETKLAGANFYSAREKLKEVTKGSYVDGPYTTALEAFTTDADGYVELKGLGDDRIAQLIVSHDSIETSLLYVRSEVGEPIDLPGDSHGRLSDVQTYYPNRFTFVAGDTRPVIGRLLDHATGEPVAGVTVEGYRTPTHQIGGRITTRAVNAVSAADGSFKLVGLPIGESELRVRPPKDSAYIMGGISVTTQVQDKEVVRDVKMRKGVMQRGRIVESGTDIGVRGYFQYHPMVENAAVAETPMLKGGDQRLFYRADAKGNFEIPVLSGRGILTFKADDSQRFQRGVGADAISWSPMPDFNGVMFRTLPSFIMPTNFHYLSPIELEPGQEPEPMAIEMVAGVSIPISITGTDGLPVTNDVYVSGQRPFGGWQDSSYDGLVIQGYQADVGRKVMIYHPPSESMAATVLKGDAPESLELQLKPSGRVAGRLVDQAGEPIQDAVITNASKNFQARDDFESELTLFPYRLDGKPLLTDQDGRFSIGGLLPEKKYGATAAKRSTSTNRQIGEIFTDLKVKAGQTTDLGVLRLNDDGRFEPTAAPQSDKKKNTKSTAKSDSSSGSMSLTSVVRGPDENPAAAATAENGLKVRVTLPNGKAAAGAYVSITGEDPKTGETMVVLETKTGSNGECWLDEDTLPKDNSRENARVLLARIDGYGISWMKLSGKQQNQTQRKTVEVKLSEQEIIQGKLVDIEGQPAAGESLQIDRMLKPEFRPSDINNIDGMNTMFSIYSDKSAARPLAWLPSIITDDAGQFKLTGVPSWIRVAHVCCEQQEVCSPKRLY